MQSQPTRRYRDNYQTNSPIAHERNLATSGPTKAKPPAHGRSEWALQAESAANLVFHGDVQSSRQSRAILRSLTRAFGVVSNAPVTCSKKEFATGVNDGRWHNLKRCWAFHSATERTESGRSDRVRIVRAVED
jgi:hypothetical protein